MNELKTLEEARAFFENDVYATKTTGIKIDEIGDNYAKCSLDLGPGHKNAAGAVMGGALFTLADFCFAVAANLKGQLTVSSHSDISFLSAAKGDRLYAEAHCLKDGRRTAVYRVSIYDDTGAAVAEVGEIGMKL
jgi:hypothetical protein